MLRWTNTSPLSSPQMVFAGTRASAQPIQRICGCCEVARRLKKSASLAGPRRQGSVSPSSPFPRTFLLVSWHAPFSSWRDSHSDASANRPVAQGHACTRILTSLGLDPLCILHEYFVKVKDVCLAVLAGRCCSRRCCMQPPFTAACTRKISCTSSKGTHAAADAAAQSCCSSPA